MADVNKFITADEDDAGTLDGAWSLYDDWFNLGYDYVEPDKFGLRFLDVTIPNGATIISAVVRFRAAFSLSTNPVNVKLYCQDIDNASTFSDEADYDGRAVTPIAGIDWDDISAWTEGSFYNSPDISVAVQNVVNRVGWASGNALAVLVKDNGSEGGACRVASSYHENPSYVAELIVSYSVGGKSYTQSFIC